MDAYPPWLSYTAEHMLLLRMTLAAIVFIVVCNPGYSSHLSPAMSFLS